MTETTPDKPYYNMTADELKEALKVWEGNVENAGGFASAHFAAQQVAAIVSTANKKGLNFKNNYPIKVE